MNKYHENKVRKLYFVMFVINYYLYLIAYLYNVLNMNYSTFIKQLYYFTLFVTNCNFRDIKF